MPPTRADTRIGEPFGMEQRIRRFVIDAIRQPGTATEIADVPPTESILLANRPLLSRVLRVVIVDHTAAATTGAPTAARVIDAHVVREHVAGLTLEHERGHTRDVVAVV